MADVDFSAVFSSLRPLLTKHSGEFSVVADTPAEYSLHTRSASPFPQHKGQPLFFSAVKTGKAYVSYHLLPLYMCPALNDGMLPALKKRMQGKACFNFTEVNAPLLRELKALTRAGYMDWKKLEWVD